jgi:IS30 family transposase
MRFYSHLSDDERDQIAILRAAGRSMGAIGRVLGRAKTTITRELQRNALPSGGYSPLHAGGAYQLRRRREAILEREAALRLFVGDRLGEGWTPEQISGWLKSGNEPRLRAIGCEDHLRLHLSDRTEGRGLVALFDASPQTPSPASRQSLARHHQGSSVDP